MERAYWYGCAVKRHGLPKEILDTTGHIAHRSLRFHLGDLRVAAVLTKLMVVVGGL